MSEPRRLVVNADDFGRSAAINRGILRAHDEGIVTSASLMVRWGSAAPAAAAARERPRLGLGLHLDLGEWEYRDGAWRAMYEVVPTGDRAAVEDELARQLDAFARLTGGAAPTHIDSHQHVHRDEPVRSAVLAAAAAIGVPVRHAPGAPRYCGAFYGQGRHCAPLPALVSVEALARIVAALPAGDTELACHPAAAVDFDSAYAGERVLELGALCDPRVREAVRARGIELCGFGELAGATQAPTSARSRASAASL